MTLRFTSPQAPRVEPIALMTDENTVFKSCFNTPCSWKVCLVVSLRVPMPNCSVLELSDEASQPTILQAELWSDLE